jgi:hypothetical protein
MSAEVVSICKFYQNGYCKFNQHCRNKHEDKVCEKLNDCRDKSCQERHPKLCRSYSKYKTCRHKEKCAYLHREDTNPQSTIIEAITMLLMKHEQDIKYLVEEVKALRLSLRKAEEASQQGDKDVKALEKTKFKKDLEKDEASEAEEMFKCEKCSYRCRKEITLNKHMNTKHVDKNSDIVAIQSEKTLKPTNPGDDYKKERENSKFFCDECGYGCTNKKSLKKHKSKDHKHEDLSTAVSELQECELCEKKFKTRTDLQNHIDQSQTECHCTEENTCEGCMYEWMASGRSPQDYPSS